MMIGLGVATPLPCVHHPANALGQHAVLTLPRDRADAISSRPYLKTRLTGPVSPTLFHRFELLDQAAERALGRLVRHGLLGVAQGGEIGRLGELE